MSPRADKLSPKIMSSLLSYLSASTPAIGLNNSDGKKANKVIRAVDDTLPVC